MCALCVGISSALLFESSSAYAQGAIARLGVGEIVQSGAVQDSMRRPVQSGAGERRISIELRDVPLKEALKAIAARGAVVLFYNDRDIPARRRVTIVLNDVTVSDAIRSVLRGTGMRARATESGVVIEARSPTDSATSSTDTTGTIVGSVVDSATGEAVAGATITVRGADRSASTDASGRFRIADVKTGTYALTVRRLGYGPVSREVSVRAGTEVTLTMALVPVPKHLDEIVTTATGAQARKEVGNLIATIAADSIVSTAPVTNLAQLLAGRAAGLQVQFGGGLTGASSPISIRGQNSLSLSTQPLLVIDGVRVANTAVIASSAPVPTGPSSGRFDDIDPTEIESVEIVKGPSAATLYGTDAANGVIIIRTKHGQPGPPRWDVLAEGGTLTFDRSRFPTSYFPWGHAAGGPAVPTRCVLLAMAAGTCVQDSVTQFSPLRAGETTPIGEGSRYKLGVRLHGGAAMTYMLSATRESETGYLKMPTADERLIEAQAGHALPAEALHPNRDSKYSIRGNFRIPAAHALRVDVSAAFSHADIRIPDPAALLYGGLSTGIRDENDGWTYGIRPGDRFIRRNSEHVNHFTGGITSSWEPTTWLTGHLTAGLDFSSDYLDRLGRAGLGFNSSVRRGARENSKVNITLQTLDAGVSLSRDLASTLTSRTSFGLQYNHSSTLTNTAAAVGMLPGAETVAGGTSIVASEATVESIVAGAYFEESVGWRDALYLTGALRVDGASSFGAGFRSAVYPKASVSWLLSEEPFFPRNAVMSSLRLRAAFGESGVQPGPVAALESEVLFPAVTATGVTTGARLGALGNRDLQPERQRELEAGLDLELFTGRVQIQATYYDKRSRDALVQVAMPASFGGGTRWQNFGAVRNRGYEALVGAELLRHDPVRWSVTVSGSINDNTVLALSPSLDAIYQPGTALPSTVRGYPFKSYFDFPIESFEDVNGDGIITTNEVQVGDTPVFGGRGYPRTQLGISTTIGLLDDHLRLAGVVERRGGYVVVNAAESLRCTFGACAGTTFQGQSLRAQAASVARTSGELHRTMWGYYEDGSFTRLREIALTYDLSTSAARWMRTRSASITIAARNLALWSAYSGTDPEIQSVPGYVASAATYDNTGVPAPTYWLLRVNLGF